MASFISPSSNSVKILQDVVYVPHESTHTMQEKNPYTKDEQVAHNLALHTYTCDNSAKSKRAAVVRWTSFSESTVNAKHKGNVKEKTRMETNSSTEFHEEEEQQQHPLPTPFSSYTTTNKSTLSTTAARGGPLSLENLLRESQQQLRELLWYRRLCRTQQTTLDAAGERQKALEDALVEARSASHEMTEQHRAYVVGSAEELRQLKTSLELREGALRVMEDEVGGLRRENERLRKLHQQAEADHEEWSRWQNSMEKKVTRLLTDNDVLRRELNKWRIQCEELEKSKNVVGEEKEKKLTTYEDEKEMKNNSCACSNKDTDSNAERGGGNDGTKEEELFAVVRVLQTKLDQQEAEMNVVKKSALVIQEDRRRAVDMVHKRLTVLHQRAVQLTAVLVSENKTVLATGKEEEVVQDTDSITSSIACFIERLEQQWGRLEEIVTFNHREAQQQQQRLRNQLDAMEHKHVEEIQAMQSVTQKLTENVHRMEVRYTELLRAMEQQSRIIFAVTRKDMQRHKGATTSYNKKEEEGEEAQDEVEEAEDGGGQEKTLEQDERQLDTRGLLTSETILDSSHKQSVQLLLRRTQLATRSIARQLRETRLQHDAFVAKAQEERRRLSMTMTDERLRHQAVVKRLQASLKTAGDNEASLQTQLTALTHSTEAERHVLMRRVEAAERDVQAKGKQERQLQRQLRETQQNLEKALETVTRQEEMNVALNTELTIQQNVSREKQFDVNALQRRCDDLSHMMDAVESQVQREVQRQRFLYETVRQLCEAIAVLALRVNNIVAERQALWHIYEAQCLECRAVLRLLQDFMRKEEGEEEEERTVGMTTKGLQTFGQMACCMYGRSLYAVAVAVMACGRMKQLMRRRRKSHHVTFDINNGNNIEKNINNDDNKKNSPLWHMMAPNSLHRLLDAIPLLSAVLVQTKNTALIPTVELPPLSKLMDMIVPKSKDTTVDVYNNVLHQLMAVAELEVNPELSQFYRVVDMSLITSGRRVLPSRNQSFTSGGRTFLKTFQNFLRPLYQRLNMLREKLRQQDLSIQSAKEENLQLTTALQKREELAAGLARKLHDYEQHVAESYVNLDVYHELQERLQTTHDALQEERRAKRLMEEANVSLQQREVELMRTTEHMRGELRFLTIELAEQQQQHYGEGGGNHRFFSSTHMATSSLMPLRSGVMDSNRSQTDVQLYVPRSVRMTAHSSLPTHPLPSSGSVHMMNVSTNNDGKDGGQGDEVVWRIIEDLNARIEKANNMCLPPMENT